MWTNPSPTSNFSEQDIILGDITKYNFIYIFVRAVISNDSYLNFFLKNEVDKVQIALGFNISEKALRVRTFTPLSNGVRVGKGYSSTAESSGSTVPYQIYGVRIV